MFRKKKENKNSYFMFNYVCHEANKCAAFSVKDGEVCADWYDDNGERHIYEGLQATDGFWKALEETTEKLGVFAWKAYKLYSHFAFSVETGVFNAEAFFPTGKSFSANNLHGEPCGFEDALAAYKALFALLAE